MRLHSTCFFRRRFWKYFIKNRKNYEILKHWEKYFYPRKCLIWKINWNGKWKPTVDSFLFPPDLKCLVYFYSTPLHSNYSWVVLAGKTRERRIFTFRIKIDKLSNNNRIVGLIPMKRLHHSSDTKAIYTVGLPPGQFWNLLSLKCFRLQARNLFHILEFNKTLTRLRSFLSDIITETE